MHNYVEIPVSSDFFCERFTRLSLSPPGKLPGMLFVCSRERHWLAASSSAWQSLHCSSALQTLWFLPNQPAKRFRSLGCMAWFMFWVGQRMYEAGKKFYSFRPAFSFYYYEHYSQASCPFAAPIQLSLSPSGKSYSMVYGLRRSKDAYKWFAIDPLPFFRGLWDEAQRASSHKPLLFNGVGRQQRFCPNFEKLG